MGKWDPETGKYHPDGGSDLLHMKNLIEDILEEFAERACHTVDVKENLFGYSSSGHRWIKQGKISYDVQCPHKDRPHEAKGMCKSCYNEMKRKQSEAADPEKLARRRKRVAANARKTRNRLMGKPDPETGNVHPDGGSD